jgi:hypothetical protein
MWPILTKETLAFDRTTVESCRKVYEYPLSEWKLHTLGAPGMLKGVCVIYLGGTPPISL